MHRKFELPSGIQPIVQTLELDYCWVCDVPQKDYPEFEQHHIVPSHLGGNKGPTVTLCEICHTKAHKMAEKLWHSKEYSPYKIPLHHRRCVYLGTVICRARQDLELKGNLNKRYKYSDTFSYQEHELLVKLQTYYNKKSQGALIRFALERLASQTF